MGSELHAPYPPYLLINIGPLLTGILQYYFTYCEVGFQNKTLGDVIITVGREGAMELMEGIPL